MPVPENPQVQGTLLQWNQAPGRTDRFLNLDTTREIPGVPLDIPLTKPVYRNAKDYIQKHFMKKLSIPFMDAASYQEPPVESALFFSEQPDEKNSARLMHLQNSVKVLPLLLEQLEPDGYLLTDPIILSRIALVFVGGIKPPGKLKTNCKPPLIWEPSSLKMLWPSYHRKPKVRIHCNGGEILTFVRTFFKDNLSDR